MKINHKAKSIVVAFIPFGRPRVTAAVIIIFTLFKT